MRNLKPTIQLEINIASQNSIELIGWHSPTFEDEINGKKITGAILGGVKAMQLRIEGGPTLRVNLEDIWNLLANTAYGLIEED